LHLQGLNFLSLKVVGMQAVITSEPRDAIWVVRHGRDEVPRSTGARMGDSESGSALACLAGLACPNSFLDTARSQFLRESSYGQ